MASLINNCKKTDKELWFTPMAPATKAAGKRTNRTDMADTFKAIKTVIRDSIQTERQMAKANWFNRRQFSKEIFSTIFSMDKARKFGKMEPDMWEITSKVKNINKELTTGRIASSTEETSPTTKWRGMESTTGPTKQSTKGNGRTSTCMEKEP